MIRFTCGSCQTKFALPAESGGKKGKCPKCGAVIEVPAAAKDGFTSAQPAASAPDRDELMPAALDMNDSGEIPLADGPDDTETKPPSRPAPTRNASGLVIMPMQDVSLVDFQHASILDGQVIEAVGRDLYALVDDQARRKIILDFTKVRFLSSQMLGVIITLYKKSAAIKGQVVLCGLRPDLLKVFAIMKIDKLLKIVGTESQAMEAVGYRGGT